jgi:hypothetical protein
MGQPGPEAIFHNRWSCGSRGAGIAEYGVEGLPGRLTSAMGRVSS